MLSAGYPYERIKAISRPWLKTGLATSVLVMICLTLSLIHSPLPSIVWPHSKSKERHSKEAYALYLPASNLPGYFEDGVLLTIFGLMTDPELRDPHHRDVVVIVTNQTDPDDILRITATGAKVFHAPYELEPLMPSRETWHEAWRHTFDKLWLWALTDYERVLYLDADTVLNRPIWPIWDEPEGYADSGFASANDGHLGVGDRPRYFNSGFMLLRPNMTTFEEIIHWEINDDDPMIFPDQDLLNYYFSPDGPHPWAAIDHKYVTVDPIDRDVEDGVHILHAKCWQGCSEKVRDLYYERKGRKKGWEMAKEEEANGGMIRL